MKNILFGTLASGALMLSCSVSAQQAPATSAYVDLGIGQSQYDLGNHGFSLSSHDKNPTGYKADVGFRLTPNFGAELGYADLGKQTNTFGINGVNLNADLKTDAVYIAGTAEMPLGDRDQFSLMGKLGASWNRTTLSGSSGGYSINDSNHKTGLYAGVGAAYHFTDTLAATVGYDYFGKTADNDSTAGLWFVGARFGF